MQVSVPVAVTNETLTLSVDFGDHTNSIPSSSTLISSPYLSKLITFRVDARFKMSRRSANIDCGENLTPFTPAITSKRCITKLCGAPEEIAVTTSPHFVHLTVRPSLGDVYVNENLRKGGEYARSISASTGLPSCGSGDVHVLDRVWTS